MEEPAKYVQSLESTVRLEPAVIPWNVQSRKAMCFHHVPIVIERSHGH